MVPVFESFGEPVKGGDGKMNEVPQYITAALESRSNNAAAYAKAAVKE